MEQFSLAVKVWESVKELRDKERAEKVTDKGETKKKKIIGLSCGRKNANCEALLKEAAMGAEEFGVETEIIRASELRIKPCTGCNTCIMSLSKGKLTRCPVKDDDAPWIFAISAQFIDWSMKGQFDNTAIIMMGCDCFHFEDLAYAFIQRGASTYIAWDASVMLDYVDGATATLVEKLCSKELTIKEAVAQTMEAKGPDPNYGAVLKYYPSQSANKTLRQVCDLW